MATPASAALPAHWRPEGTAVIAGGEEGGRLTGGMGRLLRAVVLTRLSGHRVISLRCTERSGDLEELARLMEAGTLTPALDKVYPLERVAQAMRDLEAGRVKGESAIISRRGHDGAAA